MDQRNQRKHLDQRWMVVDLEDEVARCRQVTQVKPPENSIPVVSDSRSVRLRRRWRHRHSGVPAQEQWDEGPLRRSRTLEVVADTDAKQEPEPKQCEREVSRRRWRKPTSPCAVFYHGSIEVEQDSPRMRMLAESRDQDDEESEDTWRSCRDNDAEDNSSMQMFTPRYSNDEDFRQSESPPPYAVDLEMKDPDEEYKSLLATVEEETPLNPENNDTEQPEWWAALAGDDRPLSARSERVAITRGLADSVKDKRPGVARTAAVCLLALVGRLYLGNSQCLVVAYESLLQALDCRPAESLCRDLSRALARLAEVADPKSSMSAILTLLDGPNRSILERRLLAHLLHMVVQRYFDFQTLMSDDSDPEPLPEVILTVATQLASNPDEETRKNALHVIRVLRLYQASEFSNRCTVVLAQPVFRRRQKSTNDLSSQLPSSPFL